MNAVSSGRFVVLIFCGITSMAAIGAAWVGDRCTTKKSAIGFPAALARWDGAHYEKIAAIGYSYDPDMPSSVAFFPAYPLIGRGVSAAFQIGSIPALAAVSNVLLLAAFFAMALYVTDRDAAPQTPAGERPPRTRAAAYAVIAMAVAPATFFFRMAYSESLLLLISIVVLYAMIRRWPLVIIALAIGFATAVRPVGLGLLLPFAWHVVMRSRTWVEAARRLAIFAPLACWGLAAFMAFQYRAFAQPFAFAQTQVHWQMRPLGTAGDKLLSLASLEPVWSVYVPGTWGYWAAAEPSRTPLFDLQFANPIYFVGTAALVIVGMLRGWLTPEELLLSVSYLAIPYVTRAYEMCMVSQGRFAAVVFPAYIVAGNLLARLPTVLSVCLLFASAALMTIYAAQFGAGYELI